MNAFFATATYKLLLLAAAAAIAANKITCFIIYAWSYS